MKRIGKIITITLIVLTLFCGYSFIKNEKPSYLSNTVLKSCSVTKDELDSWFTKSKISECGAVNPPNNATFSYDYNCNFYKWAEQMFL
jgi:hypothetical protein